MTIGELKQALSSLPDGEDVVIKAGQITLPVRGVQLGYIEGMKTVALIIPGNHDDASPTVSSYSRS